MGEKDGQAERHLKSKLQECFEQDGEVEIAFLAVVAYEGATSHEIALCLRGARDKSSLLKLIGTVFTEMFNSTQHLDICFLSEAQLLKIGSVATPFYPASASGA